MDESGVGGCTVMANSLVERSPTSRVARLLEHVERRMGRTMWEAAEGVAARARGQQLFRQADRLMEMMERLARALVRAMDSPWRHSDSNGNRREIWGSQTPMPLKTAIPLVFLVLPLYTAAVILMMAPYIPILILRVITGPSHVLQECWPSPTNIEKCLRRWRRRLRGIRFSGLRKMRIMSIIAFDRLEDMQLRKEGKKEEEGQDEEEDLEDGDSVLGTLLVWWPITVLTMCGQLLGLGGPWVPAFNSPVRNKAALESSGVPSKEANVSQGDTENVSPRKRKFLDFEADQKNPTMKTRTLESDGVLNDSNTDSSEEYESDTDSDSGTLADSVDFNKSAILPKILSPLMKLLTDSPLSSDDEEDDPNYVPIPEEEAGEEGDDDGISEDFEDVENESIKEIEDSEEIKSEKLVEEEAKEHEVLETEKICELETMEGVGKESIKLIEMEKKNSETKVFTEPDRHCDKTLTPRSAQAI